MTGGTEKEANNSLKELVKTMVSVIEEKDEYIKGHSERVATNCVRFAIKLGFSKKEIEKIYLAGLLHDIGMVYIPLEITQKPGELSEDEKIVVKQHPIISEKILSKHNLFDGVLPIIRHHHEAFDGSGYPDGLKGDEISIESRILGLVNSYEAMVSARPHRPSWIMEKALEEIEKSAGRQFDGNLVNGFVEFIRSNPGNSEEIQEKKDHGQVQDFIIGVVKRFKGGEIDLPVLPKVVQGILGVMNQPHSTVDDIAEIVKRDAVISVRLISVSNSPLYRGTEKIDTVSQAIPRLGVKETQSIVTAIANKSLYKTENKEFKDLMEKLWLHSLACAFGSRSVAKKLMLGDVEKFFLMGLVHDIGKAPLLKVLTETFSQNESLNMSDVIAGIQEVHTSFGGALLSRWGFAKDFNRIATRHEGPHFSPQTEKDILIVHLANNLVSKIGYSLSNNGHEIELSDLESLKLLEIEPDEINLIGEEVKKIMEDVAHIF